MVCPVCKNVILDCEPKNQVVISGAPYWLHHNCYLHAVRSSRPTGIILDHVKDIARSLPLCGIGVDIGAEKDKDDWTGRMLSCVGSEGKVYAFEPDHEKFEKLRVAYAHYPNVILEEKAVSDYDGPAVMIKKGTHLSLVYSGEKKIEVAGVTLDSYFAGNPKIDCLKIDAEGGEYRILQGCRNVIAANPGIHIFLELHLFCLSLAGVTVVMMMDLFRQLGLEVGFRFGEPIDESGLSKVTEGYGVVLWAGE